MALKPEFGVMGGLALGTLVFAIHQNATPSQADMRGMPAGNNDIDEAEKRATWISAGAVSLVSLLAKDPTMFTIGSAMTIGMALWTRHSNYVESTAGRFLDPAASAAAGTEPDGPEVASTAPYAMFGGSDFER